jgi:hypothetical protein
MSRTAGFVLRFQAEVSNTIGMLELYGSAAGGMQPGRHGRVEPVVLARVDPPEQLDRLLATAAVINPPADPIAPVGELCVSTRRHRVTVPLRVRLRPLNRILFILGRGAHIIFICRKVGGVMPPCPRGDQDGDDNVDDCNTRLPAGPFVDCAPVACSSAARPRWRLGIHHHTTDRLVTGVRNRLPGSWPSDPGREAPLGGIAVQPRSGTHEPRSGAVALVSLTETIVTPAQTRPASRDSRLAQRGRRR